LQQRDLPWQDLRIWLDARAKELGFADLRITDTDVSEAYPQLIKWLDQGFHGDMSYMEEHQQVRSNPEALQAGAIRSICLTMPYLTLTEDIRSKKFDQSDSDSQNLVEDLIIREEKRLQQSDQAVISLYARGRDYHKVIRSRLQILAQELEEKILGYLSLAASVESKTNQSTENMIQYRVFTDSAPLMEVELARKSGLGWRGKHTLLLNRQGGSFFFLGEILINLPLPIDEPSDSHCGSCQACIDICPTQAIVAPYQLDARRCISYLTIEHHGSIPEEFRSAMGNRVYGCDDCQLVCPWNKYAQLSSVPDFMERNNLGHASLLELWAWSETQFNERHAGSAIRRIGYERWRRNLAVALGNALRSDLDHEQKQQIQEQLQKGLLDASPLVAEHIKWALGQASIQTHSS
jgi:epoxyqueuosine reductase